jgi:FAD:protein FMN transferase
MQARIVLYADDADRAKAAADAAFAEIAALDAILSDWRDDSEVAQVNAAAGGEPVRVSDALIDVLQRSIEVSRLSDGAFDVTIGPVTQLWRRAREKQQLPAQVEIDKAQALVDWRAIENDECRRTVRLAKPGLRLDFGGIGKGYAADRALVILRERHIPACLVALAGDIALGDPPPEARGWSIAIADGLSNTILTLELANCGISTSGDVEQFLDVGGERRSHIVTPHEGLGLPQRIAATVIAPDATAADALATAVCVMGSWRGMAMIEGVREVAARMVTLERDSVRVQSSETFPTHDGK